MCVLYLSRFAGYLPGKAQSLAQLPWKPQLVVSPGQLVRQLEWNLTFLDALSVALCSILQVTDDVNHIALLLFVLHSRFSAPSVFAHLLPPHIALTLYFPLFLQQDLEPQMCLHPLLVRVAPLCIY